MGRRNRKWTTTTCCSSAAAPLSTSIQTNRQEDEDGTMKCRYDLPLPSNVKGLVVIPRLIPMPRHASFRFFRGGW